MKIIFFKIALFFTLFSTIGCAPVYYKPNLMNVPNFREKDELFAAAHVSDYGSDGQIAYAVGENVGIQANYMAFSRLNSNSEAIKNNQKTTKGYLGEFAVGYFSPLSEYYTMGIYGGYGVGNVQNDWKAEGISSADLKKTFIQPSVGLRREHVELIVASKMGRMSYFNLNQTYTTSGLINEFNQLQSPIGFVEMSYTIRFGFKNVKLQLQATTLERFNTKLELSSYEKGTLGVGICVQLNTKKLNGTPQ